jgi:hypothetical protein
MAYKRNLVEDEAIERIDAAREQPVSATYTLPPPAARTAPLMSFLPLTSIAQVIGLCRSHDWEIPWLR